MEKNSIRGIGLSLYRTATIANRGVEFQQSNDCGDAHSCYFKMGCQCSISDKRATGSASVQSPIRVPLNVGTLILIPHWNRALAWNQLFDPESLDLLV